MNKYFVSIKKKIFFISFSLIYLTFHLSICFSLYLSLFLFLSLTFYPFILSLIFLSPIFFSFFLSKSFYQIKYKIATFKTVTSQNSDYYKTATVTKRQLLKYKMAKSQNGDKKIFYNWMSSKKSIFKNHF